MSFKAKYDGFCRECKETINAGDQLEWVDKQVVHADCLPDAVRDEVPRPTCPKCWTIIALNGACGCEPE